MIQVLYKKPRLKFLIYQMINKIYNEKDPF
jgi:hypothetical protein